MHSPIKQTPARQLRAFVYEHPVDDWRILVAAFTKEQAEDICLFFYHDSKNVVESDPIFKEVRRDALVTREVLRMDYPDDVDHYESAPYWRTRIHNLSSPGGKYEDHYEGQDSLETVRRKIEEAKETLERVRDPWTVGDLLDLTPGPRILTCSENWEQDGLAVEYDESLRGPVCFMGDHRFGGHNLSELANSIAIWGFETFPSGRLDGCIKHLRREVNELTRDPTDGEEMADVFHLLCQIARLSGVDLGEAVAAKFKKNRERQWAILPDADGVFEHVDTKRARQAYADISWRKEQ